MVLAAPAPYVRRRPQVVFDPTDPKSVSVTNQSDKDSTDINLIFARYEKSGFITIDGQTRTPIYGDFSVPFDFHLMSSNLAKVQSAFDVLPAAVRSRFGNDPAQLIAFLADTSNDAEAVKLGLKDNSNALIALADDGKTLITPDARAALDAADALAKAAAVSSAAAGASGAGAGAAGSGAPAGQAGA